MRERGVSVAQAARDLYLHENMLRKFGIKTIAAGHCTGWRAMAAVAKEFPDALAPTAVGKQFTF